MTLVVSISIAEAQRGFRVHVKYARDSSYWNREALRRSIRKWAEDNSVIVSVIDEGVAGDIYECYSTDDAMLLRLMIS